jgi:NAD(P)H-hydrate epimerase
MMVMPIPFITAQQMAKVDRLMVEEFGISLLQMMENAGRNLAEWARRMAGGQIRGKRVVLLCGGGNNGGGGLVAARHLHNWGAEVLYKVVADPEQMKEVPVRQLRTLKAMGLKDNDTLDLAAADLVVDALVGYGLSGNPRGAVATWIERINRSNRPVLALDIPSGLDATSGIPGSPCLRATATLTLALPKVGLLTPQAKPYVGELYLADISVPPALYRRLGIEMPPLFHEAVIVKISEVL